jgi:ubiquinone/menaquinone biosynthesis C-methylase UbiE
MKLQSLNYLCCPECNSSFELSIEEELEEEIIQGVLKCSECNRYFRIDNALPYLNFPENLEESDSHVKKIYDGRAQWYDLRNRLALLSCGAWEYALMQNRVMRSIINSLELENGDVVLETGTGTGNALPIIAEQIGREGQLHGSDISAEMLKLAQRRIKSKKINAELVQANASYLPYQSSIFNAIFHMGGWNTFADKKRAMDEMWRVAKPGAKIMISDEGFKPGKEKTWIGKSILWRDKKGLFSMKPPFELVPSSAEELNAYWIFHDIGWIIEFRKSGNK